jgi:anti-sigma factor RsiW
MSTHLTSGEIALQELSDDARAHVRDCLSCANALLDELELKHTIHAAGHPFRPPDALRARVQRDLGRRRARVWPMLAAAAAIAVIVSSLFFASRPASDGRELVDLHVTLLASANPIDVVSTDRHTVKPWFEGRVPFSFPIPELAGTPFRLIGGRVVYWRQQPGAYLLLGKGGHRLSLFVFRSDSVPRFDAHNGFNTRTWRANGLLYVAVSDLTDDDLRVLERAFLVVSG